MLLGDEFPNFEAETTKGRIRLYDYMGDGWAILFSHPADFTPVCTTEMSRATQLVGEFAKRNVKLLALSCDSVEDHLGWSPDVAAYAGCDPDYFISYPLIADTTRELAVRFGMLDPTEKDKKGLPLTARCVFIIGPDKRLKFSILYPTTTGRNFTEILRVVDSLQLTRDEKVATPADWTEGDRCMVLPTVKQEDLPTLFPKGVEVREVPSGKGYLRFTPQPDRC